MYQFFLSKYFINHQKTDERWFVRLNFQLTENMQYFKNVIYSSLLLLWLIAPNLTAQKLEKGMEHVVYLKNGSILRGTIIERNDAQLKVEILGGSIFAIERVEVIKIETEKKQYKYKSRVKKDYIIKNKGIYHSIYGGLYSGTGEFGDYAGAFSFQWASGYQWNQWLGVGIGVENDSYIDNDTRNIVPIFAEVRGYFLNKPFSPYYALHIGYGIASKVVNIENNLDADGGLFIHPQIGLRFPSRSNAAFTMALGYTYQRANYEFNDWQGNYWDRVTFQRVSFRLGVLF